MGRTRYFPICAFLLSVFIWRCDSGQVANIYSEFIDDGVKVYGPYLAVKLPIVKGVKLGNPIQIALGPGRYVYAMNQTGEVYTLHDSDGDGLEDSTALYCDVSDFGLRSPVGFAHKVDTVFIGTSQQVRCFLDHDGNGKADTSWVFYENIPNSEHPYEWTSGLQFGPDGWLYLALTTDSWNAGSAPDPEGLRGSIIRISPDGENYEVVARGIRSVPGMVFNPLGDLFFLDNEGGGNPTEELNRLQTNAFYGHNKKKFFADSGKVWGPEFNLESEVAPSSLEFNRPDNYFGGTGGDLFVSYYGPGERWTRGAVSRIKLSMEPDSTYQLVEYTIADIPKLSDLAFGADGSLYLAHHGKADYWYNSVYPEQGGFYRLFFDTTSTATPTYVRTKEIKSFSPNTVEKGKQIFAETGCLGCHQVDGVTELLGPNLKDVGKNYSRTEILESIRFPSMQIKPSMGGVRITKKDGSILLGRVVSSDEESMTFMLVGNKTINIPRNEIENLKDEEKSLMFENLLSGMPEESQEALLDFLISLSAGG